MNQHASPSEIVDLQLIAYNAHDIDAYCKLFAETAILFRLDGDREVARGVDAIRAFYSVRFQNTKLHCKIIQRMELGNFVIDREHVVGVVDGLLEVVAIYEVRDSLIQTVRFIWP